MAMAWLTSIINSSSHPITFKSNDPSCRPFFRGRSYGVDEPFTVEAGGRASLNSCVVSWRSYGRLLIEGPAGSIACYVDHPSFWEKDYLYCVDQRTSTHVAELVVGHQGGSGWGPDVSFELTLNESGVNWRLLSSSFSVQDILDPLVTAIRQSAGPMAGSLFGQALRK